MRRLISVAKNFQSRRSYQSERDFSSSISPVGSAIVTRVLSSLLGITGFMMDDIAKRMKTRKLMAKVEEEGYNVLELYKEKCEEFKKLNKTR